MAFPTNNAQSVSRLVTRATADTGSGITEAINTGVHNLFEVPGVVDVTGMEFAIGFEADNLSGTPSLAASTNLVSSISLTFSGGGGSGDLTTATVMFAVTTSTVAWVARVPRSITGTSTTDLAADDWVNFEVANQATTVAAAAMLMVNVNYIYGKPATIN